MNNADNKLKNLEIDDIQEKTSDDLSEEPESKSSDVCSDPKSESESASGREDFAHSQSRKTRRLEGKHEVVILKNLVSQIINIFKNEPWLLVMIVLGIILGLLLGLFGYWNFLEPVLQMLTIIFVVWAWLQTRKREAAHYEGGGKRFVVVVEAINPVSEAVKHFMGDPHDSENPYELAVINVNSLLGKSELESDEDYEKIIKAVYTTLACNQDKELHVFLSGPVAMNFLLGQMVGIHKFKITAYQYYPKNDKQYMPLPHPHRDWLIHDNE